MREPVAVGGHGATAAHPAAARRPTRRLATLHYKEAGIIGFFQTFALLAGISRSGISMVGGLARAACPGSRDRRRRTMNDPLRTVLVVEDANRLRQLLVRQLADSPAIGTEFQAATDADAEDRFDSRRQDHRPPGRRPFGGQRPRMTVILTER